MKLVLLGLGAVAFLLAAGWVRAPQADAHPVSTTAVLLTTHAAAVSVVVQMPLDALSIAVDETLTATSAATPEKLDAIKSYLAEHLSAADVATGAPWTTTVGAGGVQRVDDVEHVVLQVELLPPHGAAAGDFRLSYDAIVHRLLNHEIFVTKSVDGADSRVLGVLDWQHHTVDVSYAGAPAATAFTSAIRLGIHHISGGADHLLFLLMLLLPAPLVARQKRWARSDDLRRSCWRVVHVVTAFSLGHSTTLALATLGYLSAPVRVVESLIACSVLVSAVHAIRPLTPRGEPLIAVAFGLMHGMAFGTLLEGLGLTRGSVALNLLGFNLGIEMTQLLVVALVMPSLLVLSTTSAHRVVRTTVAAFGILLASGWLAERTTILSSDPFSGVTGLLVEHPLLVAAAVAIVAASARVVLGSAEERIPISAATSCCPLGDRRLDRLASPQGLAARSATVDRSTP